MAEHQDTNPVEVDGVLALSEVDDSLTKAKEHTAQLEERARMLQAHFQQAQKGMNEITRLCDEADLSVMRSQSLLNRSAHRIHELNERMHHLLEDKDNPSNAPLQEGPSFGSLTSPSPVRAGSTASKVADSRPGTGAKRGMGKSGYA
eukprot:CAMPEP_0197663362 /NCGR_PEP_ID=MMETSP1338-20131121/57131_1 /TAXON_ID=43686 ORGANISM="Pelagodinium beii, Strain RCC1491" /NCGR_SAMPLE_ID=MMETSP1338 /ASSEMBLY_ACC=CAM_ASM_000754 /LENGTH=146 /DNA_ID=CAMNT_0043241683 /DNA_START=28 /DNA_END=468 /DNA_ORIENTATION=-